MKTTRIAFAACILLGASGGTFAQSNANISQDGIRGEATIDQTAPAGSTLWASILQSGSRGTARIEQRPGASGGPIEGIAGIFQQTAGTNNEASIRQTGTTGGTDAAIYQDGNHFQSTLTQKNANTSFITSVQSNIGYSDVTVHQIDTSLAFAQARQAGSGNSIKIRQARVDNSTAYVSQDASVMPGYYQDGPSEIWVEVDPNVAGGNAIESSAKIRQSDGNGQTAYILQYGSYNKARVAQSGFYVWAGILQAGSGNDGSIAQSGSHNTAEIKQYGNGDIATLSQGGFFNTARITQR
jgi:hypothetical protein